MFRRFWQWLTLGGATVPSAREPTVDEMEVVEAMARLMSWVSPTAPQAVLDVAFPLAFKDVRGYGGHYKDCVLLGGRWRDLIRDFGLADARWELTVQWPQEARAQFDAAMLGL